MRRALSCLFFAVALLCLVAMAIMLYRHAGWFWSWLVGLSFCALLAHLALQCGARLWSTDAANPVRRACRVTQRFVGWGCVLGLTAGGGLFMVAEPTAASVKEAVMLELVAKQLSDCPANAQTTYVRGYYDPFTRSAISYLQGKVSCRKFEPWPEGLEASAPCRKLNGADLLTCTPGVGHLAASFPRFPLYRVTDMYWRTGDCSGQTVAVKLWNEWAVVWNSRQMCWLEAAVLP